jgi:hypothetical protein
VQEKVSPDITIGLFCRANFGLPPLTTRPTGRRFSQIHSIHMNKAFALLTTFALAGGMVFAGDLDTMIKQSAKDQVNKSDAQQGIAPQYPSSSAPASSGGSSGSSSDSTATTPAAPDLTPEQQSLLQVINDFGTLKDPATTDTKTQLTGDLSGLAHSTARPSAITLQKLANDLSAAMAGKTPTVNQRGRMAKDIQSILSGANVPADQMDDIISDVPYILKRMGADDVAASAVGDDLKAANAEIQKKR